LAAHDPRFAHALTLTGPLPLRLKPDGFGALLDAIIGQQVSTQSAAAIWARLAAAGLTDEARVAAASEEELRACGLSRQKIRYAHALAAARIDYTGLRDLPDAQVMTVLTAVPGIGTWTAEIYAMFSLGRADVFAPGDLALQEAARRLFDLPDRPKEKPMRAMAAQWSPWQSVAATLLWAYYRVSTAHEGIR
jgi:DNA-3-methyladenine glycosylase II